MTDHLKKSVSLTYLKTTSILTMTAQTMSISIIERLTQLNNIVHMKQTSETENATDMISKRTHQ